MAFSDETKQKLIAIAENLHKVYDNGVADGQRTSGSSSHPYEVIHFANGRRLESRINGIYLVSEARTIVDDNGEDYESPYNETPICDEEGYTRACYADDATYAIHAGKADKICLEDGVSLEAREDGIWIVDGEEEIQIYDSDWQQLQAQYSDYANEADYAFCDPEGRELKGTTLYEFYDSYAYVVLNDREVLSYDVVDNISVELPDEYYVGFESKVYFTTPSSVGSDFVQADDVYFKGDNTNNGVFTPEADTRYTINFEYNGNRYVGTVSGVPVM